MSLRIAVQMDPIESVKIGGDSTFALMLEAQKRGHSLHHYLATALSAEQGRVRARARPLSVKAEAGAHYEWADDPATIDLGHDSDVVLMRQDQRALPVFEPASSRKGQGTMPEVSTNLYCHLQVGASSHLG